ncbi:MAG TPA: transposase [Acidimicrobiia bacterium]|nr:transposase [Acidimicrobiia bacterium]
MVESQINAVNHQTDLVLLTIGGNDGGFAGIVQDCLSGLSVFDSTQCDTRITNADTFLDDETAGGFRAKLESTLEAIEGRLPVHAKIVLLSYRYLDLGGYPVGDAVRALGDKADTKSAEAVAYVNQQAGRELVVFVDTVKSAFAGHEPRGGLKPNLDRWIHEFPHDEWEFGGAGPERVFAPAFLWYHPNSLGHQAYADVLAPFGPFVAQLPATGDVDIVFVVDATSSMGGDLDELKGHAAALVAEIESAADDTWFGLVTYRDDPAHTGNPSDYTSRVDFPLSEDSAGFVTALQQVVAAGGGDSPDSVLTGVQSRARVFADKWSDRYPGAVACLIDDLGALTVHLRFPAEHRKRIRHSNFIERTIGETRRRVKVIGRLPGETSCLSLYGRSWTGLPEDGEASTTIPRPSGSSKTYAETCTAHSPPRR